MKLDIVSILTSAVNITILVLMLMMIIEYVNVKTRGAWSGFLEKHPSLQIFIAALMGLIPGCLGAFAVVSLYTHRMVTIGAIVATFIATFGDEAFFMMSLMPITTLWMSLILFIIAVFTGFVVDFFAKNKHPYIKKDLTFEVHKAHECKHVHLSEVINPKSVSRKRVVLILVASFYVVGQLTGVLGHSHDGFVDQNNHPQTEVHQHQHTEECNHEAVLAENTHVRSGDLDSMSEAIHQHSEDCDHDADLAEEIHVHTEDIDSNSEAIHEHSDEHMHDHGHGPNAETIMFVLAAMILLFILFKVNSHFVEEHLWNHVIKKHFLKVFLWTFGALLLIGVLFLFIDVQAWVDSHQYALLYLLFIALIIGIIPESGPHYVIILLFLNGVVPFSILLANSIVQDGHGGLPLLAETKRGFLLVKAINVFVGLIVGLAGFFMGW